MATTESSYIYYYFKKIRDNLAKDEVVKDSFMKLSKVRMTNEKLKPFKHDIPILLRHIKMCGSKALTDGVVPVLSQWEKLVCQEPPPLPNGHCSDRPQPRRKTDRSSSSIESNCSQDSGQTEWSGQPCSQDSDKPAEWAASSQSRDNSDNQRQEATSAKKSFNSSMAENDLESMNNPHLSIETVNPGSCAEGTGGQKGKSPTKSPYTIEMMEGMFRTVKTDRYSSLPPPSWLSIHDYVVKTKPEFHKLFPAYDSPLKKCMSQVRLNGSLETSTPNDLKPLGKGGSVIGAAQTSVKKGLPLKNGPVERTKPPINNIPKVKSANHRDGSELDGSKRTSRASMDPDLLAKAANKYQCSPAKNDAFVTPKNYSEERLSKHPSKRKSSASTPSPQKADVDRRKSGSQINLSPSLTKADKSGRVPKHPSNHIDAVLDCDRKVHKPDLPIDDAEQFITHKKERRSVYSGKKNNHDVVPLYECCVRFLSKHFDCWKYSNLHGVDYEALAPVLERLPIPQLLRIEELNKHLISKTNEVWKNHCNREYRGRVPMNNEDWRTLYQTMSRERKQKLKNLTAGISEKSSKTKLERKVMLTSTDSLYEPSRKRSKTNDQGPRPNSVTNGISPSAKPPVPSPATSRSESQSSLGGVKNRSKEQHSSKSNNKERHVKLTNTDSLNETFGKGSKTNDHGHMPNAMTNGISPSAKLPVPSPVISRSENENSKKNRSREKSFMPKSSKKAAFTDKEDAPLMSKVKKTMSLVAYRAKQSQ